MRLALTMQTDLYMLPLPREKRRLSITLYVLTAQPSVWHREECQLSQTIPG